MIRVFGQTDKTFTSNGDIVLKPLKARVHKKDNGDYYLELETGLEYIDFLLEGNVIVANTPTGDQAFRIDNVTKTKNKLVSKCWHVSYDSKNYLIAYSNVENKNCNDALVQLNNATEPQSEFTVASDIINEHSFECIRKSLFGALQDVVGVYGGHLVRDNFSISVVGSIGTDHGIIIQYKKNLKDITVKENWSSVVTKLLPVGKDGLMLNAYDPTASIYLESSTQYDLPYCKTVTFQQDINKDDYGSEAEYLQAVVSDLTAQGNDYLTKNCIPQVNYTLKANLDRVTDIGDTVEVIDERLGVHLMTHVIGFTYDCIFGQYTEVEFGNFSETISGLVGTMTQTSEKIAEERVQTSQDYVMGAISDVAKDLGEISDYIKSNGTTGSWTWRKYKHGVVEAWRQVTVNASDVSWSSFLTDMYFGTADVTYPFTIANAVISATMNDGQAIGWITSANTLSSSGCRLSILRQINTGSMTINLFVRGTES